MNDHFEVHLMGLLRNVDSKLGWQISLSTLVSHFEEKKQMANYYVRNYTYFFGMISEVFRHSKSIFLHVISEF